MSFLPVRAAALAAAGILAISGATDARMGHHPHAPSKAKLTISLDGTLGPVISGSDPAGLDGSTATVTIVASESLKPYKTTAKSASYHIPAGGITVDFDGTEYESTSKSTMVVALGKKADTLTLNASLDVEGFKLQVSDVTSLAGGSWPKTVLEHPTLFSPTPQNLSEPSSNFTYNVLGENTELGVTGTADNSAGKS
jgi:hypothetical protein